MGVVRMSQLRLPADQAELGTDFFQSFNSFPKSLCNVRLGAESFDKIESLVKVISHLMTEFHWRVGNRQEHHSQGGQEEIVEADLLRTIDVRGLIQACKHLDGVLGYIHPSLSLLSILHDGGHRM